MLHNVFVFGFAGVAALCALGAWINRAKRTVFFLAALAATATSFGIQVDTLPLSSSSCSLPRTAVSAVHAKRLAPHVPQSDL